MLLRVTNLGPIREAELDLAKPLIVLVGPNNSGKTYLAWVAYSLARMISGGVSPPPGIRAWAGKLLAAERQTLPLTSLLELRDEVMKAVAEALQGHLPEDFAVPRDRFAETRVVLAPNSEDDAAVVGHRLFTVRNGEMVLALQPDSTGSRLSFTIVRPSPDGPKTTPLEELTDVAIADIEESIAHFTHQYMMSAYLRRSYVALPVERLAINLFARELAANRTELVDELLTESTSENGARVHDELRRRAGTYPRVIRDALQTAIRSPRRVEPGPMHDLADQLETAVLGGSIGFTSRDDVEFRPRGSGGVALRLHESASVVKSLVSLVLYLRYEAQPGQCLVIDEPELNLHPDNQRRVARILAQAINRGLHVMMSTHSDYVIRELNNLVMLGQGSEQAQALGQELGYRAEETLRPEQIGAYLVNGGECRALPVSETGFEVETIEDEIHRLNRDSQRIYQRLFCD